MKSRFQIVLAVGFVALLATGCVSTSKFETAISDVTTRVDGLQTTVEEHGEQIDDLAAKDEQLEQEVDTASDAAQTAADTSQAAMQKASEAEEMARGKVLWQVTLTRNDINFGVDKVALTDSEKAVLDELARKVKGMDRAVYLEIQGHTDSTGSEAYNMMLGEKRAEAAQSYLYEKGIPLHLMTVVSFGESKPIADNDTAEGRAENRRVEVLVLE
jgi:outer membrane protein OmpA-like peptidoglycan-associated protein